MRLPWQIQADAGIDFIPSNDFSFYDQMLDTTVMLGAIPGRYQAQAGNIDLDTYFAMARGNAEVKPMDMTKWFDTNYHYIVPEFEKGQTFGLSSKKIVDEFLEAKAQGIITRPVVIGPITYLMLGKVKADSFGALDLLDQLVPIYVELLQELCRQGAQWVQIDEPILATDIDPSVVDKFKAAYKTLLATQDIPQLCLATYFGDISDQMPWLGKLPFQALHIDLVRAPEQLKDALKHIPATIQLSLGVINGRNIWKANLAEVLSLVDQAVEKRGQDAIVIAPSCSLLHSPIDLDGETNLALKVKQRLAFACQKLDEIKCVKNAVAQGQSAIAQELSANKQLWDQLSQDAETNNPAVRQRLKDIDDAMFSRKQPYAQRRQVQQEELHLPLLATTTIGSFPQTPEIRKARSSYKKKTMTQEEYTATMQAEIKKVIAFQEEVGLDVLVHGEPERNDMVEYFGQMLDGFAFTANGWVQSYGSRCVKPPVIYGDVSRSEPMTVAWSKYAQSLSDKPVKGMLTGPITILQWSFVREDQPRKNTAWQIALAIRDEVSDLEKAGISIIQIDEPALKEGTPLQKSQWDAYFDWSVKAFRLATSSVDDATQIHTHMCYSEFNDIMNAIAGLDADVISIEASRSDIELLDAFVNFNYPNEIGPGVYDIHSPRIPTTEEIKTLLKSMLNIIPKQQLWVNPDCGLKTRNWPEVKESLQNMTQAAIELRKELAES